MNKSILPIILGIFLLGLTSAIYSGEIYQTNFTFPIVNCSILNNTYNLDGLNMTWNNVTVKIETAINYQPDNFTLSCLVGESVYNEDIVVSSHGGGHSNRKATINTTNLTIKNETLPIIDTPTVDTPKEEVNQENDIPKIEEKKKLSTNAKIAIIGGIIILLGVITFIVESKRIK